MTSTWVIINKSQKAHPFWNLLHMTAPNDHVQDVMCALGSQDIQSFLKSSQAFHL
jgi:hypothetical protein